MMDPDLTFRMATHRGDLVVTWKAGTIRIDGNLTTEVERLKLQEWLGRHRLTAKGDLSSQAVVETTPLTAKAAMEDLVGREVGEAGWLVYGVDKKGKARILGQRAVKLDEFKEVVKAPRPQGG
ncbi:MAG: hypothetical protein Q8P22_02935 [Chloroflexota bacterium]|nr:hypothetical protein [Chloroflexota bacterium]